MTTVVKSIEDANLIRFGEPYIILTDAMEKEINAELPSPSAETLAEMDAIQSLIQKNTANPTKEEIAEWEERVNKEKENQGQDKKAAIG